MIINTLINVHNKSQWSVRLICLVGLAILLTLVSIPERAYAEWPPFKFRLKPLHNNGRITYQVNFTSEVDGMMNDIILKIPLPAGTRFVEAGAEPSIQVDFDGSEVTFFTAASQRIREAYFIVAVTDPTATVFTTHAWLAWKGDEPGDYLTKDYSIDITRQPLPWQKPPRSRVQLSAGATVADDTITYTIYPINIKKKRILDLKVSLPIPEGTTLASVETPPSFVASYPTQQVDFSTITLGPPESWIGPLIVRVPTQGVNTPYAVTRAWAIWRNEGRKVGQSIPVQEEVRLGDLIVEPQATQRVIADANGDVPFGNYDVSSLALGQEGLNLKISFYMAGEVGPVGAPLEYRFYLDRDCRTDTGKLQNERGVELRVRYRHDKGRTDLDQWDEAQETWSEVEAAEVKSAVAGNRVTIWVPTAILNNTPQFCWVADAKNKSREFYPNPPTERVPDKKTASQLTQYELLPDVTGMNNATAEFIEP